jgi:hypothetical protein
MILHAAEKSNDNLDRAMMPCFRSFVQQHELKDMYLRGRIYTWSNERESPTLTRIDKALTSVDWELIHTDAVLQALSSSASDHAPIHLSLSVAFQPKKRFKFEYFCTNIDGFDEAGKEAWICEDSIVDPFKRLDALVRNAAKSLQA